MARPSIPRRRARKTGFAKGEYYPKVDLSDLEGRLPSSWSPSSVVTPAEEPADEESVAAAEPAREEEEVMPPPVVSLEPPAAAAAPSPAPVASAPRGDAEGVLRLPISLDLPAARPLASRSARAPRPADRDRRLGGAPDRRAMRSGAVVGASEPGSADGVVAVDRQLRAADDRGSPTPRDRFDDANEWRIAPMSMTILTVDDSRTMRDMLKVALTDAGYRVVQAVDGMHGLEVLEQETPHVIITDINMPKLDGFGFIESVRRDQRFLGVPILVLTTESSPEKKNLRAARRRDGMDRQAVRLGQAGRRRAPRGGLSSSRNARMDTMAAIRETFFQECEEQLGELEVGLLAMDEGDANSETVNAVFRAVHSIKGGAGAFKLDRLVRFAHTFETSSRSDPQRAARAFAAVMKTMLRSADVLADLVKAARGDEPVDEARIDALIAELKGLVRRTRTRRQTAAKAGGEADGLDFQPVMLEHRRRARGRRTAGGALRHQIHAEARSLSQGQRDRAAAARTRAHGRDRDRVRRAARAALDELDPEGAYLAWRVELSTDRGHRGDPRAVRIRRRRLRARDRRVSPRRCQRGASIRAASADRRRRAAAPLAAVPPKAGRSRRATAAPTRTTAGAAGAGGPGSEKARPNTASGGERADDPRRSRARRSADQSGRRAGDQSGDAVAARDGGGAGALLERRGGPRRARAADARNPGRRHGDPRPAGEAAVPAHVAHRARTDRRHRQDRCGCGPRARRPKSTEPSSSARPIRSPT